MLYPLNSASAPSTSSLSKLPVASLLRSKPVANHPLRSARFLPERYSLVPRQPWRFVIEVSDSESDSEMDDPEPLASASPSNSRRLKIEEKEAEIKKLTQLIAALES